MFAQSTRRMHGTILGVAITVGLAQPAIAGPISTFGDVAGLPPVLVNPQPGMAIPTENLVTNHFGVQGLDNNVFANLSLSALSTIDGTTALVPVVNNGGGYNLDYGGFVGFQIVHPIVSTGQNPNPSSTNYVSVEFIGANPSSGFLYAMDSNGGILSSTIADDGVGPNGGLLATIQMDGIGMFAAWSIYDQGDTRVMEQNFWGVAAISIDDAFPIIGGGGTETPEPATMSLAGIGILGALSAAWKRRRNSRRPV